MYGGCWDRSRLDPEETSIDDKAAHGQARRILEVNRSLLVEGARQLLAKETLVDDELEALLRRVVMPPSVVPVVAPVRPAANA
jgi:hypothetical protein